MTFPFIVLKVQYPHLMHILYLFANTQTSNNKAGVLGARLLSFFNCVECSLFAINNPGYGLGSFNQFSCFYSLIPKFSYENVPLPCFNCPFLYNSEKALSISLTIDNGTFKS